MSAERSVFGRSFRATPLWMWVLQRTSGVLLGPLVALHILVPGLAKHAVLNALLLVIVLAHGYSGVRRIGALQSTNALYFLIATSWFLAVAVFGVMIVAGGS